MTNTIQHNAYSTLAQNFGLKVDAPLKGYTSFKVGGPADLLSLPQTRDELTALLKAASESNIPITLFGGGTNLLITDKGIRGLVIITRQLKSTLNVEETNPVGIDDDHRIICLEAGQSLSNLCRFALDNSLSGLEFAAGIPGTVGGAIAMNAGTPASQMSDIIESLDIWDMPSQEIKSYNKKTLNFSYRNLDLPGLIVGASIKLKKGNKQEIESVFKKNIAQKKAGQPVAHASAGCFFKNPQTGKPAGELIEKSGLKGTRVNDAMVSKHHANYIVNLGNAASADILLLKEKIQNLVFEKFNINLETEVRIEGE
jgi:UDP-N-acetylmuramate dehydrogenase